MKRPVELDPNELLGLRQVATVSGSPEAPHELGRVLSKIGNGNGGGEVPQPSVFAKLLSKIGPGGEVPDANGNGNGFNET